ncbi:MAG: hypothetical protein ABSH15_10140 [Verrucomicrobiota bacterium]
MKYNRGSRLELARFKGRMKKATCKNRLFKAEISSFLILPSAFQVSLVTPAATHIDETKSPFRFSRKGLERSKLN